MLVPLAAADHVDRRSGDIVRAANLRRCVSIFEGFVLLTAISSFYFPIYMRSRGRLSN
jgi:hypothetical protein